MLSIPIRTVTIFPCDVLVIGSGAAGLSIALHLAKHARVTVIAKEAVTEGSTYYAQGGISAVINPDDSVEAHVADTINAGAGLCHEDAVRLTASRGAESVRWLVDIGVNFTGEPGQFHLTREGGHSHRRVVHAADATGRQIENTLVSQARSHPNIDLLEDQIAIDLVTTHKLTLTSRTKRCIGAYVLDREKGAVQAVAARFVVLATGGASKVYLYTSNPDTSSGDGIAMAWRAGCRVANMEFNQFHPTCMYHPRAKSFLITEALRGEGGRLLLPEGEPFMNRFDSRGELAPRDIVARAIDHEMKRLGADCVYLDISHRSADFITGHFPNVYRRCLEFGYDLTREPIPVVPAAHYTCGGVMTELDGRTDVEHLYAAGEVAHTGLHGANRMASNSLLECVVFGKNVAEDITARLDEPDAGLDIPPWDESRVTDSDELVVISHNWDELRRFMWDYVGIVRTTKRLQRAKRRVDLLFGEINEYYSHFRVSGDLIELRNLALVADLIIRSALSRRESRGLHYTLDFPERDGNLDRVDTVLSPGHPYPDAGNTAR